MAPTPTPLSVIVTLIFKNSLEVSPCCPIQAVISIALLLSVVKGRPTEREGGGTRDTSPGPPNF